MDVDSATDADWDDWLFNELAEPNAASASAARVAASPAPDSNHCEHSDWDAFLATELEASGDRVSELSASSSRTLPPIDTTLSPIVRRKGKGKGRGGGRPHGSAIFRQAFAREQQEQSILQIQQEPMPGSIAYARQIRLKALAAKGVMNQKLRKQGTADSDLSTAAMNELSKHGDVPHMWLESRLQ